MADTDWSFFDIPATAVQNNLNAMAGRADAALKTANDVIAKLEDITFDPEPAPPNPPPLDFKVPVPVTPTVGEYTKFGRSDSFVAPEFDDLWAQLGLSSADFNLTIKDFESHVPPLEFPADPAALDASGKPDRPTVETTFDLPDAPDVLLPALAALAEIDVDFQFPTLPTFDAAAPQFEGVAPSTTISWSEPTYLSTVESDLVLRVRAMLAGGTGLPANVQQALFDQARSHEAQTALEAEQGAFDSFAGKGFAMPSGMLAAAVRRAQEKSRLEQNAQARDLLTKAAQWEIENLRQAVTQGMAYETLLRNYFNNVATRSFEVQKFRVESDLKLYDAQVTLFNARQQAFATLAQVFKVKIDSTIAELQARIQAAVVKSQLNEQLVKVYLAEIEGVKQVVSIYHEKMEAAKTRADVAKTIIASYGEDVKAYAAKITAEKERFTAYYERVRAEGEKAKALEYEARAYEATVRGSEAKANLKKAYVDARIGAMRESVAKFAALVEAERDSVTASVQAIQANAAAFTADTQRYTAEIQGVNESVRTQLLVQQEDTRNRLAEWETTVKEYDARLMRMLEQTKIVVGALDAAARTSSTLAAGAMSAIHVQASMGADGHASSASSYNVNINRQGPDVA